jgi:hypothetical protein
MPLCRTTGCLLTINMKEMNPVSAAAAGNTKSAMGHSSPE